MMMTMTGRKMNVAVVALIVDQTVVRRGPAEIELYENVAKDLHPPSNLVYSIEQDGVLLQHLLHRQPRSVYFA